MHIFGGQFRNRPLKSPKGQEVRPTSGRLREALFNICQGYIADARFLDLFAGSGAMGLEALSRGAVQATFVEKAKDSIRCIQQNAESLEVIPQTRILSGDALYCLEKLAAEGHQFDIIFADPPYGQSFGQKVLEKVDALSILAPEGVLFIEEAAGAVDESTSLKNLILRSSRQMGRSLLLQYLRKG